MTIQYLKDNRDSLIETITENIGEENVKEVMNIMVSGLDCCDSLEELIESSLAIFEQNKNKSNRKVSKLATLVCAIQENENN